MKKSILIPEETHNQIADIAIYCEEAQDEMAEHLLTAEVTAFLQRKTTDSPMFYPGRSFEIDPKSLIQARMLASDVTRLQTWLKAKDPLEFLGCGKNELIILNQSTQNQKLKGKKVAIPEALYSRLEEIGKNSNRTVSEVANDVLF